MKAYYASTTLLLSIISSTAAQHYTDLECVDTPGFIDPYGDDCAWYSEDGSFTDDPYDDDGAALYDDYYYYDDNLTRCKAYGFLANWDLGGMTAQESCCICGGGSLHHQFCTDYVPEGQTKWLDLDGFGCKWYSKHIEGTYVDDGNDYYYQEGENRCSFYGGVLTTPDGYSAQTACCACGGGIYGNTCVDLPDFVDGLGRGCDYFNSSPVYTDDYSYEESHCLLEGHLNPNPDMGDMTADMACCSCGGGVHDYIGQPSAKPSLSPTKKPTPSPTPGPVGTPSKGPTVSPVASPSKGPTGTPVVPVTSAPVTSAPTKSPVTPAPVAVPVSMPVDPTPVASPVTVAPATLAPVKADPVTEAPVPAVTVSPPVTDAPVMATPTTSAPTGASGSIPNDAPPTNAPVTVPTTLAPVTDAPTAAPVTDAPTAAPVTDAPTPVPVVSTSNTFTMSFDRMNCSVPLNEDALTILANLTANFLNEGASFEIQDMQVTEVNRDNCGTTSTARQTGYGVVDFQMMMKALIKDYGDAVGVLATHVSAKFNDTEAVSKFLTEIRNSEVLTSAFELVVGADVNDMSSTIDTNAPTAAPTAAPVTDAPVESPVASETTKAPVADGNEESSSAFAVTSNLSRVMLAVVACAFASASLGL